MAKRFKEKSLSEEEEISRIRKPRQGEVLCIVEQMLGSDKLRVRCDDGFERIARIPGKLRKRVWIRTSDLILLKPWSVQTNERGDVAWRYTKTQANWMQRNKMLKNIKVEW